MTSMRPKISGRKTHPASTARRRACATAFIAFAIAAGACKSKPNRRDEPTFDTTEAAASSDPTDAAGRVSTLTVSTANPALPAALRTTYDPIKTKILSDDSETRLEGYQALEALLAQNQESAALATTLLSESQYRLAKFGLAMWKTLGSSHPGFVPAMRRAFTHTSDQLREAAVSIFWMEDENPVAADLQRMLTDPSCLVRAKVRFVLLRAKTPPAEATKATLAALSEDACPNVQAWALQAFTRRSVSWPADEQLLGLLTTMASESPYYQLQCLALTALAELKVAAAEALIGKSFAIPATTALAVDFRDRSAAEPDLIVKYTLAQNNMAQCAANAWAILHDRRAPADRRALVDTMWRKAAAKGATSNPPKKLCTAADDCRKGQFCVAYSCRSRRQAQAAYWTYRKLEKCSKKDPARHVRNVSPPYAVRSGLATHAIGAFKLGFALREASPKAFERGERIIAQVTCPAR